MTDKSIADLSEDFEKAVLKRAVEASEPGMNNDYTNATANLISALALYKLGVSIDSTKGVDISMSGKGLLVTPRR